MEFAERWKNVMSNCQIYDTAYITNSYNEGLLQDKVRYHFRDINKKMAINFYLNGDIDNFKLRMGHAAMICEYAAFEYNETWPRWMIQPYSHALLSDNRKIIDRYAHLNLDGHFKNVPHMSVLAPWNNIIQGLLRSDDQLVSQGVNNYLSEKQNIRIRKAHATCAEGIMNNDSVQVVKGLKLFEQKHTKSLFVKNDICEEVLSLKPAIYAKIALRKGIEVNFETKFLPKELIEINPLPNYPIPYWFLRDFYRKQGVAWKYDPIYPELQDWENDPENTNK